MIPYVSLDPGFCCCGLLPCLGGRTNLVSLWIVLLSVTPFGGNSVQFSPPQLIARIFSHMVGYVDVSKDNEQE